MTTDHNFQNDDLHIEINGIRKFSKILTEFMFEAWAIIYFSVFYNFL